MPRAQRTKSAVHEALQRRARNGPGDGFSGLLGCPARVLSLLRPAFRSSTRDVSVRSGGVSGAFTRCTPWRVLQDAACYSDTPQILCSRNKRLRADLALWSQNTVAPTAHFRSTVSVFPHRGRTIGVKAAPLP